MEEFNEEELEELRQEARRLGRKEEPYIQMFRAMVGPHITPESIERACQRVQELIAADRESDPEHQSPARNKEK